MEFSAGSTPDAIVAAPTGSVNHGSALELQEHLAPCVAEAIAAGRPLVLDFTGVDYISSMGLRVLMMVAKDMRAHGGTAVVAGLQPVVREIFEIARFQYVLPVHATVADALRALASARGAANGGTPR